MSKPLDALMSLAHGAKAEEMRRYHKVPRQYLGVSNPQIDVLVKHWRAERDVHDRVELAGALWGTNIHEARIAAAKLLTQARLRPDDTAAWSLIASWVPEFDAWAIADAASIAGQKRVVWDPARIDIIEGWTRSDHMWTRRAALVMTLPWTKQNHPNAEDVATRERVLGWAASYVDDPEWFIQKAVAWWLRDLSKHDRPRVVAFMDRYGDRLKPFARKEAQRKL